MIKGRFLRGVPSVWVVEGACRHCGDGLLVNSYLISEAVVGWMGVTGVSRKGLARRLGMGSGALSLRIAGRKPWNAVWARKVAEVIYG